MEEKEKIKLNKEKIITNAITGSLILVISFVIIFALITVIKPILESKSDALDSTDHITTAQIDRFKEAMNKVLNNYIGDLSTDDMIDGAISGMTEATGDPYTRYISEEEYQNMLVSGTEVYGGIGVHINYDSEKNGILVLGVMPNAPALDAGIKAGDLIVKVADEEVNKDNYSECVDKMKGEAGTSVALTIKREDELIEKQVERKQIATNNIESDILESNIGYIKIWSFENDIYKQFKQEYDKLMNQKVSGIIIDLRNNPGGLVSETLDIARLMLPKGDILKLVYKTGKEKVYKDEDNTEINIPLAVIANSRSASAAEILSGAIKDSGKGVLIGNKTYGKGIVQTIEKLGNRGAIAITTSKYYTASGVEIHKNGIEPNITVDLPEEYKNDITIPRDKDTQLQKAIEYVKSH